ncbi:hypothetical protein [Streptomyces sp. TRM75563]|uniref:hypothetical protein n=1 Tax=Streptomyces sp. TRM75563 TaxID=2817418 RepID=UPI001F612A75|nr:hypothetical protein [Streptomyces sp. TRM75563]MCI4043647.1 hypothetical protein [Streptomyces sp. TRM75563]
MASQPPSVENAKLCGKWRKVSPCGLDCAECAELAALVPGAAGTVLPVPSIASLELPPVRVSAPRALAHLVSARG